LSSKECPSVVLAKLHLATIVRLTVIRKALKRVKSYAVEYNFRFRKIYFHENAFWLQNQLVMKRIFSTSAFLHCFYLVAIALLSYVLWNVFPARRECRSAKSIEKSLHDANDIMGTYNDFLQSEIDDNCRAYPSPFMLKLRHLAFQVDSITQLINQEVNVPIGHIKSDLFHEKSFFDSEYCTFPTRNAFSEDEIKQLKALFQTYYDFKNEEKMFPHYSNEWEKEFQPQLDKLVKNVAWEDLNKLSAASALAQLESIKTAAAATSSLFLIKIKRFTDPNCMIFDKFSVVIAPNKGAVKVGEKFQADLVLCKYASNPKDVSISCDNQILPMREGVATYKKRFTKVGKQTIRAMAMSSNPLTGATETTKREYTIDVLPK
jgi:hypothetical protein